MGRNRIGPKCPYCGKNRLLCYGVQTRDVLRRERVRYFACESCGVRVAYKYRDAEMSWAGLISPALAAGSKKQLKKSCSER